MQMLSKNTDGKELRVECFYSTINECVKALNKSLKSLTEIEMQSKVWLISGH